MFPADTALNREPIAANNFVYLNREHRYLADVPDDAAIPPQTRGVSLTFDLKSTTEPNYKDEWSLSLQYLLAEDQFGTQEMWLVIFSFITHRFFSRSIAGMSHFILDNHTSQYPFTLFETRQINGRDRQGDWGPGSAILWDNEAVFKTIFRIVERGSVDGDIYLWCEGLKKMFTFTQGDHSSRRRFRRLFNGELRKMVGDAPTVPL